MSIFSVLSKMEATPTADALFNDRVRRFTEFLDPSDPDAASSSYHDEIRRMLLTGRSRLVVSLDDIREFDRHLWFGLLSQPAEFLPPITQALKDTALTLRDASSAHIDEHSPFYIGFSGTFGSHLLSPRTIDASFLGKLVCVEGIVTRCTIVRPKVARTIHYGAATKEFFARDYRDQTTSFDPMPSTTTYPVDDGRGNPLIVEYGMSTYRDHQTVSIQEMPERAPAGQLPRGMNIVMDDDLVDRVKPGDRVQLVGVYRSVGGTGGSSERGSTFRALLLGNNVVPLSSKGNTSAASLASITDQDVRAINQLSRRPDIFELLGKSLAPSIFGFEYIKQAVLLQLLGGSEKNLSNGTHLRGDINVLLVGDPSTAKSQMLRFVLNTANLAIATTGRGSTGVGLTAAVTTDKDTGERRLEAGAMVMADRGIVCVDEFDKMNDADRVAIHEVMEQQTVTISKAGIHTTLNARCSVLAAANPAYGQYDPHKEPHRNIALPDSLLSRFDLLFVVIDDVEDTRDRQISEHVLQMHQFMQPGAAEGTPQREQQHSSLSVSNTATLENEANAKPVQVFANPSETLLTVDFVKRYINYAKERVNPVLGDAAVAYITQVYSDLRNDPLAQGQRRTAPITARTLETLIRLSTAHAKSRLSLEVEQKDAMAAEAILRYAMFKEVLKPGAQAKRRRVAEQLAMLDEEEDDDDDLLQMQNEEQFEESDGGNEADEVVEEDLDDVDSAAEPPIGTRRQQQMRSARTERRMAVAQRSARSARRNVLRTPPNQEDDMHGISRSRQERFEEVAGVLMADRSLLEDEAVPAKTLIERVNARMPIEDQFAETEQNAALRNMHDANKLFYDETDGKVYTI